MAEQNKENAPFLDGFPEWKIALVRWALSIDETPTDDPREIVSRLEPSLSGEHWADATYALATTEAVADAAIGLLEIL